MKVRSFIIFAISILMFSCTSSLGPSEVTPRIQPLITGKPVGTQAASSTQIPTSTPNALNEVRWAVYDPDPQHIWNRLFRQLYRRTTDDGRELGWDALDPLLWHDTTYLLEGTSYQQTITVLDEFLSTKGEGLISNPLMRAIFQRDMWAVFDWLTLRSDAYFTHRQELQWRVAQVIRKVSLTDEEILSLPDNYETAVRSGVFPTNYQRETPDIGFLPADLLRPNGEWVCLGRDGGPIAVTHTQEFPFFGRSVFLIFVRVPGGREATLRFLQDLDTENPPTLPPDDTEIALVRRAMLINDQGDIVLSPIVESVQIRHFTYVGFTESFFEFKLSRVPLFAGASGGLQPSTKEIPLFRSHGVDIFQVKSSGGEEAGIPSHCASCHNQFGLTNNILSYSRYRFPLPEQGFPVLIVTTPELEAQSVVAWKQKHQTWQAWETLWHQRSPSP